MKKLLILSLGLGLGLFANSAEESTTVNAAEAKIRMQAIIEQLSKDADPKTKDYLKELAQAASVILDNTKSPIGAIGIVAGVDAGIQVKTIKIGDKNLLIGPGGQAVFGPLWTFYKDQEGKTRATVHGTSLVGGNITAKLTDKFIEPGFQGQLGLVVIVPHKNKDNTPKLKRVLDLADWYLGFAGEGAIPVFILNRIRFNVGIYSLVNSERLMQEAKTDTPALLSKETKEALDAWKTESLSEANDQTLDSIKNIHNGSLSNIGKKLNSFLNNVVIGDATMILINGQFGTKDTALEGQAEALRLRFTQQ